MKNQEIFKELRSITIGLLIYKDNCLRLIIDVTDQTINTVAIGKESGILSFNRNSNVYELFPNGKNMQQMLNENKLHIVEERLRVKLKSYLLTI